MNQLISSKLYKNIYCKRDCSADAKMKNIQYAMNRLNEYRFYELFTKVKPQQIWRNME